MKVERLQHPTQEDFAAAGKVCELRWSYLQPLHTRERFEAFQKLGVELIVVRGQDGFDGVCFVLPCRIKLGEETVEWMSLFQLATRPETKNIGALLLMRIMSIYPAVIAMGVTREAADLYKVLRWKCYGDVWRGVHPIDLRRMLVDYSARIQPWQRVALRAGAGVYNALSIPMESLLALGAPCRNLAADDDTPLLNEKTRALASYLELYVSGQSLQFVNAAGIGRVLSASDSGLGSLSHHASAWRQLRRRGAKFCEILLASPAAKVRGLRLGYFPVRMPLWYRENNSMVSKLLTALQRDEVSFLHTDKSV